MRLSLKAMIGLLLLLFNFEAFAKSGDWRWFIAYGFPNENAWEVRQGFADVCMDKGSLRISVFSRNEKDTPPEATQNEVRTGRILYPRYPNATQVAEITGIPKRKGKFQAMYTRWGTDEYGSLMSGDYFGHRYQGGGYESLTFFETGVKVIGLRRDLHIGDKMLFDKGSAGSVQCPLPSFSLEKPEEIEMP
ncbi:hypothetical protein GTP58_23870 [Duganella sp. CY15W]|uniref:hypothetical protein n=1 Tax=Duganella sp. CY15W TaxID=2692172 RepID=UPI00136B56AB|nr:hypothetical protein [Duganella sp. CY15W]MYM31380.1 hypothetical protein [Duganella sp. CY15W]